MSHRGSLTLGNLAVSNFALLDNVEAELSPGLNVITGETGAGKSLFVDALEIALGGRALSEYIRTGASRATVQALFFAEDGGIVEPVLERLGIELGAEREILIERELRANGQNRARINGQLTSVSAIRDLARNLVDMHGQHAQQGLLQRSAQLEMLDALSGEKGRRLRTEVSGLYEQLSSVEDELQSIVGDEKERARRQDLLNYQLEEIDEAELRPNEDEELEHRGRILGNYEMLQSEISAIVSSLMDEEHGRSALLDQLGHMASTLRHLADIDDELTSVREAFDRVQFDLQEAARSLRHYRDGLNYDPAELRRIESRLDVLNGLMRKYGSSIEEIMAYRDEVAAAIDDLESSEQRAIELREQREEMLCRIAEKSGQLSRCRASTAEAIRGRVERELAELSMENTRFDVRLEREPHQEGVEVDGERVRLGPTGIDTVEFLISPNPGEPLKPLRQIASGGELARIMLALKNILAGAHGTPVLIFDEVDAGVGGEAGGAIARKLADLARSHQVLCVSHLAQTAAMADSHHHLEKKVVDGKTTSTLESLEGEKRMREIARMLAGDAGEALATEHARRLLEVAGNYKSRG